MKQLLCDFCPGMVLDTPVKIDEELSFRMPTKITKWTQVRKSPPQAIFGGKDICYSCMEKLLRKKYSETIPETN